MARFVGQTLAGRRVVPSMECALVCLLVALSVAGYAMDLDRKVRTTATGLVAGLYDETTAALYDETIPAARGVPIPREAAVRVQAQAAPRR